MKATVDHQSVAGALLSIAVAGYSADVQPLDRVILFAAAAAAAGNAWRAMGSSQIRASAVGLALGGQAIVLLGQAVSPSATAATALAATWTLGSALVVFSTALAPGIRRTALAAASAGMAVAVVAGVLARAEAELSGASAGALGLAGLLVGADPIARAYAGLRTEPSTASPSRQTLASLAVWWLAIGVVAVAVARAAWRTWGDT